MAAVDIAAIIFTPADLDALAGLLVEAVAAGGSLSFMHPLPISTARAFWERISDEAARGDCLVLAAREQGVLIGTATLRLDCPPNRPHRAEIAKMVTRRDRRGRGVGTALMQAAEHAACARGRSLLVLDTAEDGGAAGFYEELGYQRAGAIPDYALKPHGGLTATLIYWKRLAPLQPDHPRGW